MPFRCGADEEAEHAAARRGVRMAFTYVRPDGPILTQIVALLGAGDILPNISRTFGLSDAAEAHRLGEGGHVSGKLVLDLGDTGWR